MWFMVKSETQVLDKEPFWVPRPHSFVSPSVSAFLDRNLIGIDVLAGCCPWTGSLPGRRPLTSPFAAVAYDCGFQVSRRTQTPPSLLPFRFCGSVRISKKIRVSGKSLVKRKLVWITLIYPLVLFLTPVLIFRLEIWGANGCPDHTLSFLLCRFGLWMNFAERFGV